MNTRRKFLLHGSMAMTAFFAAKPATSMASGLGRVTGINFNKKSLMLAHTGESFSSLSNKTLNNIEKLRKSHSNLLMLHTGKNVADVETIFDASQDMGENYSVTANDYKIIYKGDIKTGVITADRMSSTVENINALAKYLKKERNCELVVCISQLGYKLPNSLDDLSLAESSTNLDVIIGGRTENFCKRPFIARNINGGEVIMNYSASNSLALLEVGFNISGKKNQIAFRKTC